MVDIFSATAGEEFVRSLAALLLGSFLPECSAQRVHSVVGICVGESSACESRFLGDAISPSSCHRNPCVWGPTRESSRAGILQHHCLDRVGRRCLVRNSLRGGHPSIPLPPVPALPPVTNVPVPRLPGAQTPSPTSSTRPTRGRPSLFTLSSIQTQGSTLPTNSHISPFRGVDPPISTSLSFEPRGRPSLFTPPTLQTRGRPSFSPMLSRAPNHSRARTQLLRLAPDESHRAAPRHCCLRRQRIPRFHRSTP